MAVKKITPALLKEYKRDMMKFRFEQWVMDNGKLLQDTVTDWQIEHILKPFDSPKYRLYYIQLPKKVGKSTIVAYEAVTRLFLDGLKYPAWEGYFLAGSEEQAEYLLTKAKWLIQRNPNLQGILKPLKYEILFPARRIRIKILSAKYELTHQYNPDLFVFDEFWNQPDRKLFDSMFASMIKPHAKGIIITNAGEEKSGICWEIRQKCRKEKPENWYYYEPPDIYTNPILRPHWITDEWLENQRTTLTESEFARLILNQWVERKNEEERLLPIRVIDEAIDDNLEWGLKEVDLKADYYILALDIGLVVDKSVALIMKFINGYCILEDIKIWKGDHEKPVQLKEIEDYILEAHSFYHDKLIVAADQWQAVYLLQRLREQGVESEEINLQNAQQRLAYLIKDMFMNKRIKFPWHELLVWELKHMMIEQLQTGIRIKRTYRKRSLDTVFTLGIGLVAYDKFKRQSGIDTITEWQLRPFEKLELPKTAGKRKIVPENINTEIPLVVKPEGFKSSYWRKF